MTPLTVRVISPLPAGVIIPAPCGTGFAPYLPSERLLSNWGVQDIPPLRKMRFRGQI